MGFNQEISDLLGTTRIARKSHQSGRRGGGGGGRTVSGDDIAILRPEEVRQLPERQALVIAENGKPIIAKLHRCLDGKTGRRLKAQQRRLREALSDADMVITPEARAEASHAEARRLGLHHDPYDEPHPDDTDDTGGRGGRGGRGGLDEGGSRW